jgi:hypothetical protein
MQTFETKEYVPAKQIWPNAENFVDNGPITGYVRGYNVEVVKNGKVDWMSCVWLKSSIEDYVNDEYTRYWYMDCGVTPTGRISFRGYGIESYDPDERDTFVHPVGQL